MKSYPVVESHQVYNAASHPVEFSQVKSHTVGIQEGQPVQSSARFKVNQYRGFSQVKNQPVQSSAKLRVIL